MRLHNITEDEYAGLVDNDEFARGGIHRGARAASCACGYNGSDEDPNLYWHEDEGRYFCNNCMPQVLESTNEYDGLEDNDEFTDSNHNVCIHCGVEHSIRNWLFDCRNWANCGNQTCDKCMGENNWSYDYATDTGSVAFCPDCIANDNLQESIGEYDGLEDNDEFGGGCIYCGDAADVVDILQFGEEDVCVDCVENRPTYEWLRHDSELTQKKLFKYIFDILDKRDQAFGIGDMSTEKVRNGEDVVFDFTSKAKASYYDNPETVAKIIAARIFAARNAAATARGSGHGWW